MRVFRFVNHTHPAVAQLVDDAVVQDGLADHGHESQSVFVRRHRGFSTCPWQQHGPTVNLTDCREDVFKSRMSRSRKTRTVRSTAAPRITIAVSTLMLPLVGPLRAVIAASRTTIRRVARGHGPASAHAPVSSETSVSTLALDFLSAFFGSPDTDSSSKIFRLPAGQL